VELTAADLAGLLPRLPGWRGNTRRLSRTVALSAARQEPVLDAIHRAEAELDHHAQVRPGPDDLTLTLWTHSRDAVTDRDVRLAERISDILTRL
jgi:pterin-4a-carbinolamine dehydratase